jgi:hypothetical protein
MYYVQYVSFVFVILCPVFCLSVLCLIVVQLPLCTDPFEIKINNNYYNNYPTYFWTCILTAFVLSLCVGCFFSS